MTQRPVIAVAVSGGIDSLYALAALREKGANIFALHARLLPPALAPSGYEAMLERLKKSCADLNVDLHILDCSDEFANTVIRPFVAAYAAGFTPNPCAHCNAAVKFGLLLDAARGLGATRLATGHYIRLETAESGAALFAGEDAAKDQSYFLALVPRERLAFAVAPLADISKAAVRERLAEKGVEVPSPAESQEICFVPNDDHRGFITLQAEASGLALPGPGPVVLPDGVAVGRHNGLWRYTEGQRKGLGIAWKEPLYVVRKDKETNTLVVGNSGCLRGGVVRAKNVNVLVPLDAWPETILLRTRFRQRARPACVHAEGETLVFQEEAPSGPYAGGQIAVAYAVESRNGKERLRVLGGGVIEG